MKRPTTCLSKLRGEKIHRSLLDDGDNDGSLPLSCGAGLTALIYTYVILLVLHSFVSLFLL